VLELDPPGTSGEAECSRGLIQDDSSSILGRRCTHIYRATSIIMVARPYRSRASKKSSTPGVNWRGLHHSYDGCSRQ
jgi:hypothetical protein